MTNRWPQLCERCGGHDLPFGVCRDCGWRSEAKLAKDAQLRRGGVPKVAQRAVRGSRLRPVSVVKTISGVPLLVEYQCPECRGRGWTSNACDSCQLCFGKGKISGVRLQLHKQKVRK